MIALRRMSNTALAGVLLCAVAGARCLADVSLTDQYPSPYGAYSDVTIRDRTTVGSTPKASTALMTVSGDAAVQLGDLEVERRLNAGNGALRIDTWAPWNVYWTSIARPANSAAGDLQAGGEARADEFWVADEQATSARLLSLDVVQEGLVEWGELRSQYNGNNWAHGASVLRICAQPYMYLNANSGARVIVGAAAGTDPNADTLFEVGSPAAPLGVVATFTTVGSSRTLKKDVVPFGVSDYRGVLRDLETLNLSRYLYKGDPDIGDRRLGLIAEDAPDALVSPDHKGMDVSETLGFLLAAMKALKQENALLEEKISALEAQERAAK